MAEAWSSSRKKHRLTVQHVGSPRNRITLNVSNDAGDHVGLNGVHLRLDAEQADAFLRLVLHRLEYECDTPHDGFVRVEESHKSSIGLSIQEGDRGTYRVWITHQGVANPLWVFADAALTRKDLASLADWLAPRLGWELEDAA